MIQLLIILIINTLVLIAWGKYLHHLDAFTSDKKNQYKLFWLIIAGGIPSIVLTFFLSYRWEGLVYYFTGLGYRNSPGLAHFLITGPVEELSKFAVFILLTGMMKSIKEPRDGILQAASVAMGFALVENILYAYNGGLRLLLVRSVLTISGHMSLAVIWGFAWGAASYTSFGKNKSYDWYFIIPAILLAAAFHGAYDALLEYGHVYTAFFTDFLILTLFLFIYRYVRDNSPYKQYSLKEYKRAIPALKMGLNKYPKSYELNKRMGVFKIYTRKYPAAEKYLKTANRISPRKALGLFYYGVSRYLNGNTTDGTRLMNKAVNNLPVNMRKRPVESLKKIITDNAARKDILEHFDKHSLQFKLDKGRTGKRSSSSNERYPLRKKKAEIFKQPSTHQSYHSGSGRASSGRVRGTWEQLVRVRPGHVILVPYKIGGTRGVDRAGKSYKQILDEQVEEWKRVT